MVSHALDLGKGQRRQTVPNTGMPRASPAPAKSRQSEGHVHRLYAPVSVRLRTIAFYALVAVILYAGWRSPTADYLTPESGLGYALGIIGGSLMLFLLLYTARKKLRFMRRFGPVRYWFRLHMLFGVLGPVLVLFHANFQLGSTNSNVALFCMIIVALSGLIGRYLYTRIHYGLYGSRVTLEELREDTEELRKTLVASKLLPPRAVEHLQRIEQTALTPRGGLLRSTFRLLLLRARLRATRAALRRAIRGALRREARARGWTARDRRRLVKTLDRYVCAHLGAVSKVAGLSFYERLFALWHLLHLPLFFMLIIAGVVHVIAVHMY